MSIAATQPAQRAAGAALAWCALTALWLPVFWRLHYLWSAGEDQAFGWAVPVLALYLATERWRDRPAARVGGGAGAWVAMMTGALALLLVLPVWEANLFWPRVQWLGAAAAIVATAGALALAGGWRWSGHFAFPLLFVTTALSWPTVVHLGVVAGLGGANAWLAAELASACGRPALASGNIIEVGTGFVGVDEACSGLRSLQAVWMVGWLFGELFRLRWARRLLLVALALLTAFAGNVARTVFLTWQAAAGGAAAVEDWHDSAGWVILLITLAVVAVLGWWFGRGRAPSFAVPRPGTWRLPRAAVVTLIGAGVAGSATTEGWYRWHEQKTGTGTMLWRLAADDQSWTPVAVPEAALALLGNPASEGLAWRGHSSARALAYVFRWDRDILRAGAAEMHDPTLCLPAAGAVLDRELEPERLPVEDRVLEFQVYRFDTVNGVQYVFFGLWDGGTGGMRPAMSQQTDEMTRFRLHLARTGRRRAELAHITFVTAGMPDAAMARAWLHHWAPRLLRPVR